MTVENTIVRPDFAWSSSTLTPLTMGVEEEFLLVDPISGETVPVAEEVVDLLPDAVRRQSRLEFRPSMLEMVTPVCTELTELNRQLTGARQAAALASVAAGARLAAVGMAPMHDLIRGVPPKPRYLEIVDRYGAITRDPAACGCHVHVGVPDRDMAVAVCNHLRPWLPVIQALAANSPLHACSDTGHASWRSVQLCRWPSTGPTPVFGSAAEYDRAVAVLVDSGTLMDESMVYWYARLSPRYPTVEIRVGDVCATVEETVLVAALTRALVATAIDDVLAGVEPPQVPDNVLIAAHWRAARDGLEGSLLDARTGRQLPTWDLVGELVGKVAPALRRYGDHDQVGASLTWLRLRGGAAARQREMLRRTGDFRTVLATIIEQTRSDQGATL